MSRQLTDSDTSPSPNPSPNRMAVPTLLQPPSRFQRTAASVPVRARADELGQLFAEAVRVPTLNPSPTPALLAPWQLLITIAFKSLVKIESLQLTAPGDGVQLSSLKPADPATMLVGLRRSRATERVLRRTQRAPSSLKLIINRRTIGFEDAEALQGEQVLCSLSALATPSPLYPAPPLGHRSSPCRPTTWTSALSSSSSSSRTSSACVSLWRATRTSARPPRSQACCRLKAWGGRPRTHRARVARADARGHRAGSVAPPPHPPPAPAPHPPHTHSASGLTAALCFRLQA